MTEQPAVIRLPPTTKERKARYMRAAGARRMKLTDWIWETLDSATQRDEEWEESARKVLAPPLD